MSDDACLLAYLPTSYPNIPDWERMICLGLGQLVLSVRLGDSIEVRNRAIELRVRSKPAPSAAAAAAVSSGFRDRGRDGPNNVDAYHSQQRSATQLSHSLGSMRVLF